MIGSIKKAIPDHIKVKVSPILHIWIDIVDSLLMRRDNLTPSCRLRCVVGPRDIRRYKALGEEFFHYFRDLCGLDPDSHILEVGCGCCPVASPLTKYLDKKGAYEGFDINPVLIEWCRKNISSRYPNFKFQVTDIFNKAYNPHGKYKASQYKFPYENESFDLVFAKSVFTHLLPHDMENYLSEIARVLKRGGKCLITFFLLNEESLRLVNLGESTLDFRHGCGKFHTTNPGTPEWAVSYKEEFIWGLYEKYGLKINPPIHYGSWSSRFDYLHYQDFIMASKDQVLDYKGLKNSFYYRQHLT